jgi:hypothetical protein
MSYNVNRALGYQKWGVTNPWVFADLSQPQRQRGNVSPAVFQTSGPFLKSAHLGQTETEQTLLERAEAQHRRGERMEKYALLGLAISATSALMAYGFYSKMRKKKVTANRRRRRRTSRRAR